MSVAPFSILYFSNELVRGGTEEHILTLLRGLDRNRFRPLLACTPEVADELSADLPDDVPVFRLRLRKPTDLRAAAALARVFRRERIDVLHSHLFYASLLAAPIGRLCGVRVIVETPHVRESWRSGWLKGRYVVDRGASRFVDRYVAVSHANARYLIETKGLPSSKITVIHNGRDLARFDPTRPPPRRLKTSLGFGEDDPVLLVVGRLEPQKGHRVLLEALPEVRRMFPGVRLVCLGEGSLRAELEAQVSRLSLEDSVRFPGYQTNPDEWLALADVTVLPSFYEGLPLVAIESLAAGRAIVATAVDGTPEVVLDGRTGLTVAPGDAGELSRAICRLLAAPSLRRRLAEAGRRWVEEEFSEDGQIRETERLYLDELTRRGIAAEVSTPDVPVEHRTAPTAGGR